MRTIIGKKQIVEEVPDILCDESRYKIGVPAKIFFPESESQIIEILLNAEKRKIPITIIGGQTGITGGSTPTDECYAVCLEKMNKIKSVEVNSRGDTILICEPGIRLLDINAFLKEPGKWTYPVHGVEKIIPGKLFYAPDPTEMTASLGGTVATNASGARSYYYGSTRHHIESIKIVLSGGETAILLKGENKSLDNKFKLHLSSGNTIDISKPLYDSPDIKNTAGYFSRPEMDLTDLFIGSEGTLGVFTEIGIRLTQCPELIIGGLSFFPGKNEAFSFANFLRKNKNIIAIEYFDKTAIDFIKREKENTGIKLPALPDKYPYAVYWEYNESKTAPFEDKIEEWEEILEKHKTSLELTLCGFNEKDMKILKDFRHAVPELINNRIAQINKKYSAIRKISTDTALTKEYFENIFSSYLSIIEKEKLEYLVFGHLGDFHIHINILPKNPDEFKKAVKIYDKIIEKTISSGGTVSAEHGIGKIKIKSLNKMYNKKIIDEMKKIKLLLDPDNILNRGNLFK